MNIEFIVTKINKLKTDLAIGDFIAYRNGKVVFKHPAKSGGWGKGPMPYGEYRIEYVVSKKEDSYTLFGMGWFAYLNPQFKTDRTELGIHPDGNVEGSFGCCVLPFQKLDDNLACRYLLRDELEKGPIPFVCRQVLGDRKA